jgi:twitching motility protein PilT
MDNNAAQDNNVKFGYTNVQTSTPVTSTPAPQPVSPSLGDIAQISQKIDEINQTPVESKPVNSYVAQPTSLPNLDKKAPEDIVDLPEEPAPLPYTDMTLDALGRTGNNLDDIMPDFKKPKAMERDPKSDNLAKPLNEKIQKENIIATSQANSNNNVSIPNYSVNGTNDSKYKIEDLLGLTISRNASDLHLAVGYPPIIRVDGELEEVGDRILNPEDAEELILAVLSDEKKELLEVNREVDFAYTYEGSINARFRINAFYAMKNLCAAFRLIPSRIRTIEELMLPQMYHQFTKLKQGLILVTGPTGHGKSTTLASLLEDINRTRFSHIVTIEDPIEYVFEGKKSLIDQREMNDDTHSWDIALRSALRQDPDVLLVGEMRDYETISATITLAETGHLVFATLHTNSSSQTIDRIIDVFPDNQQPQVRAQLANILEAVVAQRLIPLEKGGRRAVSEIMIKNSAVGNLIREGKTNQIDNVIRTSSDIGMISLEKSLVNLVREGIISVPKAQEYAVFPEEILRLLKN